MKKIYTYTNIYGIYCILQKDMTVLKEFLYTTKPKILGVYILPINHILTPEATSNFSVIYYMYSCEQIYFEIVSK